MQQEEQSPVTDTYLEDYEQFVDEDDRWRPQSGQAARTRASFRRPLP